MSSPDTSLIRKWLEERDAEAFNEIVSRHAAMVFATCKRILGNAPDAEEVAQDCFLKLAEGSTRIHSSLGGWLHRLATNRSLDRLRSESSRRDREKRFMSEPPASGEIDWDDILGLIDEAIAELPKKYRDPIIRHFLQRETHQEIAASFGITRSAVTQRITKGLERIRKTCNQRGIHVAVALLATLMDANMAEAAPTALTAALGKLAVAASITPAATAKLGLVGGLTVMTKKALLIGLGAALLLAGLAYWSAEKPTPVPAKDEVSISVVSNDVPQDSFDPPPTAEQTATREDPEPPVDAALETAMTIDIPSEEDKGREPAQGNVISGQVIDTYGLPVGLADVVAASMGEWESPSRTTTGPEGQFTLSGLSEGPFAVGASKAGTGKGQLANVSPGAIDITIVLDPAAMITGRVYDEATGDGIEDIAVSADEVLFGGSGRRRSALTELRAQKTDADGYYELSVEPGDYTVLVHESGPYMRPPPYPSEVTVGKGTHIDRIDFSLLRGGSISGTVLDAAGEGVGGVRIWYIVMPRMDFAEKTTAEDGTYEFRGLRPGETYRLQAKPGVHGASEVLPVHMPAVEDITGVDLRLGSGAAVYGRVVDTLNRGIEAMSVKLFAIFHGGLTTLSLAYGEPETTGAQGYFTFAQVMPGEYRVGLADDEFTTTEDYWYTFTVHRDVDFDDLLIVARRKEEGFISGSVTDPQGRPMADVFVSAYSTEGEQTSGEDKTSSDGTFAIEKLGGGEIFQVRARAWSRPANSQRSFEATRLDVPVNSSDVELVLGLSGRIAGRVLDAVSGAPVQRFEIRPARYYDPENGETHYPLGQKGWTEYVSSTGEFVLTGLHESPVRIAARANGYEVAMTDFVEAIPGGTVADIVIRLTSGASLVGTVLDAAGAPLRGVLVAPFAGNPQIHSLQLADSFVLTDSEGCFRIDGLSPGHLNIGAWLQGYAMNAVFDVELTGNRPAEAHFTLAPEGRLEGTVFEGTEPAINVGVFAKVEEGDIPFGISDRTRANARFSLRGMPAGRYRVEVDDKRWTGWADIEAGQVTELEVQLDETEGQ